MFAKNATTRMGIHIQAKHPKKLPYRNEMWNNTRDSHFNPNAGEFL